MSKQHVFSVKKDQIQKFKQLLADCYSDYSLITSKVTELLEYKKQIDLAWELSINELRKLYEEDRVVNITPSSRYEAKG